MSKVVAIISMSLDGYVADLNDGVAEMFEQPPHHATLWPIRYDVNNLRPAP